MVLVNSMVNSSQLYNTVVYGTTDQHSGKALAPSFRFKPRQGLINIATTKVPYSITILVIVILIKGRGPSQGILNLENRIKCCKIKILNLKPRPGVVWFGQEATINCNTKLHQNPTMIIKVSFQIYCFIGIYFYSVKIVLLNQCL